MDDNGGTPRADRADRNHGPDRDERIDLGRLPSARTSSDIEDDHDYDPGWLGVVLRWPVRVVAVVLVVPIQVAWQATKAAGLAAGRGLKRFGRGTGRFAARIVRPLTRAVAGV